MTASGTNRGYGRANEKGGRPVGKPPIIQDLTMLNMAESAVADKPVATKSRMVHAVSEGQRCDDWLREQIGLSQSSITTHLVSLTPVMARVLLDRNPDNRHLSEIYVENFARDIENGAWSLNGEPIIVSRDGFLNDGQHRCEAVIRANKAIDVVMVVGADRESRLTLDQGRNRMAADYLSMNGHVDASALAATSGFVFQYQRSGKISRHYKYRPTKGEILNLIESDPAIGLSLSAIPRRGSDAAGGRSTLAFCHWAITRRTPIADADTFFASVVKGANLLARDPILYARNRLITERTRLSPNQKAELIFRAWNCHRRGEHPKTLPILDGVLPSLER